MKDTRQDTDFAKDILKGLISSPKQLSSKYFYNDTGTQLFQKIMRMPEYYPTNCEYEIFSTQTHYICKSFNEGVSAINIIELGAGDGLKTEILLTHLVKNKNIFKYTPIDISAKANDIISQRLQKQHPTIKIEAKTGDYFEVLNTLNQNQGIRKVVLFLGSTIGNFKQKEAAYFLQQLHRLLSPNDLLFIGFDLLKDPHIMHNAYNDAQGYSAAFNLNILQRINEELGADFVLDNFIHYPIFNPMEGAIQTFLISKKNQLVEIKALNKIIEFTAWEALQLEHSRKFNSSQVYALAKESGFSIEKNFYSHNHFYLNSLWKPIF